MEIIGGRLALIAFAKAFACEEEDLGVFHQAIGDSRGDGGVVRMLPQSEKAVLVVMERAARHGYGGWIRPDRRGWKSSIQRRDSLVHQPLTKQVRYRS